MLINLLLHLIMLVPIIIVIPLKLLLRPLQVLALIVEIVLLLLIHHLLVKLLLLLLVLGVVRLVATSCVLERLLEHLLLAVAVVLSVIHLVLGHKLGLLGVDIHCSLVVLIHKYLLWYLLRLLDWEVHATFLQTTRTVLVMRKVHLRLLHLLMLIVDIVYIRSRCEWCLSETIHIILWQ